MYGMPTVEEVAMMLLIKSPGVYSVKIAFQIADEFAAECNARRAKARLLASKYENEKAVLTKEWSGKPTNEEYWRRSRAIDKKYRRGNFAE